MPSRSVSTETGQVHVLAGWGNKWGNRTHVFQPISAELDLAETA